MSNIRSHKGLMGGVLILAIGVVLLLDQQHIVSAVHVFRIFWPAFFMLLGLEDLVGGYTPQKRSWGGIVLVGGSLLLLNNLGYIHFRFSLIAPVFLIALGIWMLIWSQSHGWPHGGVFGPFGPFGPHGPFGARGPLGPKGPLGPNGPFGPNGPIGRAFRGGRPPSAAATAAAPTGAAQPAPASPDAPQTPPASTGEPAATQGGAAAGQANDPNPIHPNPSNRYPNNPYGDYGTSQGFGQDFAGGPPPPQNLHDLHRWQKEQRREWKRSMRAWKRGWDPNTYNKWQPQQNWAAGQTDPNAAGNTPSGAANTPSPYDTSDSQFNYSVIFSHVHRNVTSKNFKSGVLSAILGGFEIDLSHADIEGEEAVIYADAIFGGGEIRIPDTWHVVIEGNALFGAFMDETRQRPPEGSAPQKRLIIRGTAVFGGVSIEN
jgi:hypothetical protein